MYFILHHIRRYDWLLTGAVFLLMILGLITLFSLSGVSPFPFLLRQLIWAGIGVVFLILASMVDFRFFRTQSFAVLIFYILVVFLLLAVLLGNFAVRGVAAWLKFGNVFLQPVELAKLSLIVFLAKFFSKRHIEIYRMKHLAVSGLYFAIPILLVLAQPDLGSAIVLAGIWIAIIVFSGMKLRHFLALM